jgi:hypothetical protein
MEFIISIEKSQTVYAVGGWAVARRKLKAPLSKFCTTECAKTLNRVTARSSLGLWRSRTVHRW